jgi:AbrB family looped-hinge helix DNA binding protein
MGIVRQMDELGRIAIPKEFRNRFKMKEGQSFIFFLENDELVIKAYNPEEQETD